MANQGEKCLLMEVEKKNGEKGMVESVFQVAQVTRPLMSLGNICDGGAEVLFTADAAIVTKGGREICRFQRVNGGLYFAKMRLKQPKQGFGRQE